MRIYEFAREHGYNSSKILSILEGLGYSNRTVMGSLTKDMEIDLMNYLNEYAKEDSCDENDSR